MARKTKVTEFFDTEEGKRQLDAVKGYINEFIDIVDKVKPVKNIFGDAQKPSEFINGLRQMGDLQKQQNKIISEGVQATEKMISTQREFDKAILEGRVEKQKYNAELKTEIQLQNAATGSIEKAKASIKSLTAERDKLNLSTEEGRKRQAELNAEIDRQNAFIKENVDAQQKQRLNVGNYQGSAKIIVDALGEVEKKIESLREKQENFQNLSKANPIGFLRSNQRDELNQVNALLATTEKEADALRTITSDPRFFNLAAVGNARTEVRGFTTTLIELEQKGLGRTDFANELRKHLAELTDQIGDTREEIKAMASDSRSFDQVSSAVNFLTSTYETFVGVQALAGDQNKEAEEVIKKLVAVQAVANGLQEVAEQLTKRGTIVNTAYVAVQKLWTTATDSSAAATVRLAAATKLLLGGLLIGGIVLLVLKLKEWADAAGELSLKQKTLNEVGRAAADSYGREKSQLDLLISSIKTEGISRGEKFRILKQLQDAYPGYFDNIKTEKDLNEKLAGAYKKASEGILLKANAEAASNLLAQNASEKLKAQIDLQERIQKLNQYERENIKYINASEGEKGVQAFRQRNENARVLYAKEFNNLISDLDKKNDLLITTIQDSNDQIKKLGGKVTKTETTSDNSQVDKALKARFELYKQEREREIKLDQDIANDKTNPFASRYNALLDSVTKQEALINAQKQFDLKTQKLTEAERKLIIQKAEDQVLDIRKKAGQQFIDLIQDNKELQKKAIDDLNLFRQGQADKEINDLTNSLNRRLTVIQRNADYEINIELGRYSTGQINKEEYENRKLAIENKARRESLLAEIDYYEKLIKISNLPADKETDALKKLSDLRKQLNDLDVKNTEDAIDKKLAKEKAYHEQLKSELKDLGNAIKDTVFSLFDAGIDRQKNKIQDQIDLIDQRTQKEIDAANQTTQSEQDKAAKIQIIQARAAAQKQQLDKKQRQLDEQKARFDRAKSVVDIIQNTAVAVVKALDVGPPQGFILAALAGAIGAAQLVQVLAQPIPKYFKGKNADDAYQGPAIVGDGGKAELIVREDGSMEVTPDKPSLTWVNSDDVIFPDAKQTLAHQVQSVLGLKNQSSMNFIPLERAIGKMERSVVKAIQNIPQPNITVENPLRKWVKSGNSFFEEL